MEPGGCEGTGAPASKTALGETDWIVEAADAFAEAFAAHLEEADTAPFERSAS